MKQAYTIKTVAYANYTQSGSFKGFKRFRLTIYEVPGVKEGIEHFCVDKSELKFEIKRGTPIRLEINDVINENGFVSYKVLEVYADNYKIGILYANNDRFKELFSKPFDKVHVRMDRIENIIYKDGVEQRPIVDLFVRYCDS